MTDEYQEAISLPQPFEGMQATGEEENLFLANAAVRVIVGKVTERLRKAYLFGGTHNYPQYKAMTEVMPGDLVMVVDAFQGRGTNPDNQVQAVGYLVGQRREWAHKDEDWNRVKGERINDGITDADRPIESNAIYIQYEHEAICRWTNCSLVKVVI